MELQKLYWDTDFFGYEIGKLEIENFGVDQYDVLMECIYKSKLQLIYLYPSDQFSKDSLLKCNIPLIGTNVTFEKHGIFQHKSIFNTRSFNANEQHETLVKLALLSGEFSRFRRDRKFLNNEYIKLYTEWIKKSISREIATDVVVYSNFNKIAGFISYKLTVEKEIIIGLLAVDSSERGQGIGKILMQSVENIAVKDNIKKIIVSTQLENKQAMAFYHSCGYKVKKQQEIFHLRP